MRYYSPFPEAIPQKRVRSHALLTRPPLIPKDALDLHVLGLPPAFVLSQDQTLKLKSINAYPWHSNLCTSNGCSNHSSSVYLCSGYPKTTKADKQWSWHHIIGAKPLVARYDRLIHRSWTKLPTYLFMCIQFSNNVENKTNRPRQIYSCATRPKCLWILSQQTNVSINSPTNNTVAPLMRDLLCPTIKPRNPFL